MVRRCGSGGIRYFTTTESLAKSETLRSLDFFSTLNPANLANPFLTNLLKKPFFAIFANVVPNKITAVHGYINAVG